MRHSPQNLRRHPRRRHSHFSSPNRPLRFQSLESRRLLAAEIGFDGPAADITGLWVTVGGREYFSSEQAAVTIDMVAGETLQVTGIRYETHDDLSAGDGVIAFESYVRREHGASAIGSYDYTDGRFADPVQQATTGDQVVSHPGFDSGWQLDVIDNRIAVVAVRYFDDEFVVEDRFLIDVDVTDPVGDWTAAIQPIDGDWQTDDDGADGDSRAEYGAGLTVVKTDVAPGKKYEIGVKAKTVEENSWANGFVVLDYQNENDFIYAGLRSIADRWVIGHFDGKFNDLASYSQTIVPHQLYDLRVAVDGSHVALAADGVFRVAHDFDRPLDQGAVGLANEYAFTHFTNFHVIQNAAADADTDVEVSDSSEGTTFDFGSSDDSRLAQAEQRLDRAIDAVEQATQALEDAGREASDAHEAKTEAIEAARQAIADHETANGDLADARAKQESITEDLRRAREGRSTDKELIKRLRAELKDADRAVKLAKKSASDAAAALRDANHAVSIATAAARTANEKIARLGHELALAHQELEAAKVELQQAREEADSSDDGAVLRVLTDTDQENSGHAYSLNFNHQDDGAFQTVAGTSELVAGQLHLLPDDNPLAIAVMDNEALPPRTSTRVYTTVRADALPGMHQNGFIVFDYQSPDDFKYAGAWAGADRWAIGEAINGEFVDLETLDEVILEGPAYELQIWIEDDELTVLVEGVQKLSHHFDQPIDDGQIGVASYHARSRFDQVAVMQLYGGAGDAGIENVDADGPDEATDAAITQLF